MPRQQLAPGEHGRISVAPNPTAHGAAVVRDAFYAQCRFHDPVTGKTTQLRRFGPSEDTARKRLQEALVERTQPDAPDDRFKTLGEAVAAFSSGSALTEWSESTARSMRYAMRKLMEHENEPWPLTVARAEELLGDGSRTSELALRLVRSLRRR